MAKIAAMHKRKPLCEGVRLFLRKDDSGAVKLGIRKTLDYGSQEEIWFLELDSTEAEEVKLFLSKG